MKFLTAVAAIGLCSLGCVGDEGLERADIGSTSSELAFSNSIWENSIWENSIWENGTWEKSTWQSVWTDKNTDGFSTAWSSFWGAGSNSVFASPTWTIVSPLAAVWVPGMSNNCAHQTTQAGVKLTNACNSLVSAVCNLDPYCCNNAWDPTCVNESLSKSDDYTGTHDVYTIGAALPITHSSCAADVDAQDSYCRLTSWDGYCVSRAARICVARFVTNTRFEDGRIMTDVCAEPVETGVPACQAALNSRNQCCQRAMVMNGVYHGLGMNDPGEVNSTILRGSGKAVEWIERVTTTASNGTVWTSNATLVPDQCYQRTGGMWVCTPHPHHMWTFAKPGARFYPDCSTSTSGPLHCNDPNSGTQMVDLQHFWWTGTQWAYMPVRSALVASIGALINTESNGNTVHIRYSRDDYSRAQYSLLPPDHSFDQMLMEGVFRPLAFSVNGRLGLLGRPTCNGIYTRLDEASSMYLVPRCCNPAGTNCGSGDVSYDLWHQVDAVQTAYRVPQ